MKNELLRYTLRMDRNLFAKFRYVAEYEGRSANKEIEQMIRKRVEKFEKINGEILLSEKDKNDLE
ncbi:MAG: Arc family DNA-binding protein [Oscillospiraceae bacterium]|nr:Arc family DNA-binding protein [Oscillospiraceae bacterium]